MWDDLERKKKEISSKFYDNVMAKLIPIVEAFQNRYIDGEKPARAVLNEKMSREDYINMINRVKNEYDKLQPSNQAIVRQHLSKATNRRKSNDLELAILILLLSENEDLKAGMHEYIANAMKDAQSVYSTPTAKTEKELNGIYKENELWSGIPWTERMDNNVVNLKNGLMSTITTDLAKNASKRTMNGDIKTKVAKWVSLNTHRIMTSETSSFVSAVALFYLLREGVTKIVYKSMGDEKVCPICRPHHNKIYNIKKAPQLPMHPNCRCWYEKYSKN